MENNPNLQIENGNYTRIANKILDELVKVTLLGAELAICLFVIRKTYGYSKTEDQISLSQFEEGVKRSRPTITKALKNLQLVNILKLVKVGYSKKAGSVWKFNKYFNTWKLVKTSELVKDRTSTSKEKLKKLVKTPKHTKDNTKDNTKERGVSLSETTPSDEARDFFSKGKSYSKTFEWLKTKTKDEKLITTELNKFILYWTEKNSTGRKERWQMEKTFEVRKRLATWLSRVKQFTSTGLKKFEDTQTVDNFSKK